MTAPAGIFGAQQQDLADLFAASAAFIAECALSTNPTPTAHIAFNSDDRWAAPMPCVVIGPTKGKTDDWGFISGLNTVLVQRLVETELAETDVATNTAEAITRFMNWAGSVVSQVILAARGGGHLINLQQEIIEGPERSSRAEKMPDDSFVDYIACIWRFTWGTK